MNGSFFQMLLIVLAPLYLLDIITLAIDPIKSSGKN
ncbi:UNVERIFIED_CONTAM: hypothetical protein BJ099_106198 [Lysinibacillus xylanilyticus]